MHMLLTSLTTIYQVRVPNLQYGQGHVDQMSRAHLRYVLTGEIAPWIDKLITYLSDPHSTEDPEPHSRSYSAGGTEMPDKELVQKTTKRGKHNKPRKKHRQHTTHTNTMNRIHTHTQ
jgi:hypothetical protein